MIYAEIFNSLQSFSQTINSRPLNKVFADANCECSKTSSESFSGTKNYEEADKLLLSGDVEKLEKLQKVNIKDIKTSGYIGKMRIEKNVCGCLPNIPLYLIGTPTNMLNFKRVNYKSKIIDIVVNAAVNSNISANEIIIASAKIASIIKALELNNMRVNLYVSDVTSSGYDYVCSVIKIKNSSAPLNMLNISYPLINPSMLRRHFFKFMETIPVEISSRFVGSYGHAVEFNEIFKKDKQLNNKFKNAIIIDIVNILKSSTEDVLNILKQAKK